MQFTKLLAVALLALLVVAGGSGPETANVDLYKKVAPAVVGVADGSQRGTGVVIDASGLILTSTTAVRDGKHSVTLHLPGHKKATAEKVAVVASLELVILKTEAAGLTAAEIGDSDKVALGQTSAVVGDSFNSIFVDGQPAMSVGAVSGMYTMTELRYPGAAYIGRVIETAAAVNPNQDGAPLFDAGGKLIGLVTLNFSTAKFTGLAIPINELKPTIERVRKGETVNDEDLRFERLYTLGVIVRDVPESPVVLAIEEDSPASRAGVAVGDLLVRIDGEEVKTYRTIRRYLLTKKPSSVSLTLRRLGETIKLPVVLKEKTEKEY